MQEVATGKYHGHSFGGLNGVPPTDEIGRSVLLVRRTDATITLFCCDADEMLLMLKEVNHSNVGLLIDTAHLKVSANTLKFNADEAVKKIAKNILCVHHSDNDGTFDTNDKLTNNYWFLSHMKDFSNITHVLEVKKLTEEEVKQQLKILQG